MNTERMQRAQLELAIDWDSHRVAYGEAASRNAAALLDFLIMQVRSHLGTDWRPSRLCVTRTVLGIPYVVGIVQRGEHPYRVKGKLLWDADQGRFQGELSVARDMPKEEERVEQLRKLRTRRWRLQPWRNHAALVRKEGEQNIAKKYIGQTYDPEMWERVEGFWDHAHCELCWNKICEAGKPCSYSEGYTDGELWVCPTCYHEEIGDELDG